MLTFAAGVVAISAINEVHNYRTRAANIAVLPRHHTYTSILPGRLLWTRQTGGEKRDLDYMLRGLRIFRDSGALFHDNERCVNHQ